MPALITRLHTLLILFLLTHCTTTSTSSTTPPPNIADLPQIEQQYQELFNLENQPSGYNLAVVISNANAAATGADSAGGSAYWLVPQGNLLMSLESVQALPKDQLRLRKYLMAKHGVVSSFIRLSKSLGVEVGISRTDPYALTLDQWQAKFKPHSLPPLSRLLQVMLQNQDLLRSEVKTDFGTIEEQLREEASR